MDTVDPPGKERASEYINSQSVNDVQVEKDITQLNRLYSTFSRIYQVIVNVPEKDEVLRKICTIAVTYGKLQMAWFGLIDDTGKFLKPVLYAGKEQGYLDNMIIDLSDDGQKIGPVAQSLREGRCILCRDISADPRTVFNREELLKRGFRSSITVPIRENSKVIGAFTAFAYDKMLFDEPELQLFEEIGQAISFALDTIEKEKQRNIIVEELEKSEERFREMFDNAPMAYHELDDKGNIVKINSTELAMLGYKAEEIIGYPAWNFVFDREASHERVLNKLKGEGPLSNNNEFKLVRKDGSPIEVLAQDRLLRNDKGEVTGIRTILQDISGLKKTEKELLIAKEKAEESDRLKTAFLHNITHEIRTPMNAIVGFSGLLNEPALASDERKYYTEIIVQNSNQLLSIITNIVNIATVEAGQEKVSEKQINLNSVIRQLKDQFMLNPLKQDISLNCSIVCADKEVEILTDPIKLKEIIGNLIENAMKFTRKGSVDFGYDIKGEFLEFYIKDTGIGIPAEKHDVIFKRFYQVEMDADRRFSGSGLGLSISKAYVELLGGKIWLISEPGKGSEFFFTIPYKKACVRNPKGIPEAKKLKVESESPKTLLIAEDEDLNFLLLEKLLTGANLRILRAVNGREAVEVCKSNPGIDLVLMDLKMPVLNGYDATKQIREFRPDLPVLVQTAYVNDADRNRVFECGCSDIISKPIEQETLLLKIRHQLNVMN
jgi:PAS domain S-box-containing protein